MKTVAQTVLVVLAALVLPVGRATAQGNPQQGRIKAYTCLGCHGVKGYMREYPTYHVPLIGGQHYQYLVNALNEYKNDKRHFSTMNAQAQSLTKQDIEDIAAWLSEPKSKH